MSMQDNFREISDSSALPNNPLVSVHMLAYRHERFLAEAIEGVIAQVCDFPFELIIAEDSSPDGTLAVALDYQKRYPSIIRVLTADENVGMLRNSERFKVTSRGEYIAICEGDDYWHAPQKLQLQIDAMRADNNITLCHTDFDRRLGSRIIRSVYSKHRPTYLACGDAYYALLHQWSVITATSVYRADLLDRFSRSKFSRLDWPFGDYNLSLFASTQGRVCYLPISTATWRKVPGSAANNGLKSKVRLAVAGVECREEFLREFPFPAETTRELMGLAYTGLKRDAFIIGDQKLHNFCVERLKHYGFDANSRTMLESALIKMKLPHMLFHAIYRIYERFTARQLLAWK